MQNLPVLFLNHLVLIFKAPPSSPVLVVPPPNKTQNRKGCSSSPPVGLVPFQPGAQRHLLAMGAFAVEGKTLSAPADVHQDECPGECIPAVWTPDDWAEVAINSILRKHIAPKYIFWGSWLCPVLSLHLVQNEASQGSDQSPQQRGVQHCAGKGKTKPKIFVTFSCVMQYLPFTQQMMQGSLQEASSLQ